ncbi:MAG: hypothetical protein IBJ11_10450 [Phycisphaerales bacterium]|nr:hypothetical protein [Phycisphaerales bacterium]
MSANSGSTPAKSRLKSNIQFVATVLMLSVVGSSITLGVLQRLPLPWRMRFVYADMISLGGGPGEATIAIAASRLINGMAMVTMKGADGQGGISLTIGTAGDASIGIGSAPGVHAMTLAIGRNGQPVMRFIDAGTRKAGWTVTLDENGRPVITSQTAESEAPEPAPAPAPAPAP